MLKDLASYKASWTALRYKIELSLCFIISFALGKRYDLSSFVERTGTGVGGSEYDFV